MSNPNKPLTPEDMAIVLKHADRVHTLSQKVFDLVVEDTADLEGEARWIVVSRVISGIFAHHFSIALSTVGSEMAKRAKAPAEQPPPSAL